MRLLVTGGTGFVGSHLAESALKKEVEVNVLGLVDSPADSRNAEYLRSLGAAIYAGSITDASLCRSALAGVSHVFHLAVAMREAGFSDDYYKKVNLDGTRTMLDECKRAGVDRFIYCGTIGIFGHRFSGICTEDMPKRPGNIYEETKLAAETLALEYGSEIGLQTLSLRPADVYGPRDQRLRKLFLGVSRGRFPLFGDGSGRRHMVFISDVVSAFEKALQTDSAVGSTFIIAGPEICTLAEFVEKIRAASGNRRFGYRLPLRPMLYAAAITEDVCRAFGVKPPIYRRRMDFFTSDSAFDLSRARSELGWTPTVSLADGIRQTLEYYVNSSDLAK
jgi:nucleoside-diphosphate-sugar epimerase